MEKHKQGNVVWVRMENGSWWPGYISHILPNRSAFLIHSIGRDQHFTAAQSHVLPFKEFVARCGKDRKGVLGKCIECACRIDAGESRYEGSWDVSVEERRKWRKCGVWSRLANLVEREDEYEEVAVILNEIITKNVPIAELADYNVGGILKELYENTKGKHSLEPLAELTKKAIKKLKEEAFELLFYDGSDSKASPKECDVHSESASSFPYNTHNEKYLPAEAKNPSTMIEQNVPVLHDKEPNYESQDKQFTSTLEETVDIPCIKDKGLIETSKKTYFPSKILEHDSKIKATNNASLDSSYGATINIERD